MPSFDTSFYEDVEHHVRTANIGYIEAIIHWCESHKVDVEHIAPMIIKNASLQLKLQREGENLHFLKRIVRLPI